MQCYIILYSNEGYFLIFEKRTEGFFFHNSAGPGGTIYPPNGTPIFNGPGLFAFPGGALNPGEQPYAGCLREFMEECGNQITFGYQLGMPQSLQTLTTVTIDGPNGDPFDVLNSVLNTAAGNYYTLYLQFATNDLRQIQDLVMNTNLQQAAQVERDIQYNEIRTYNDIFVGYPFCPLDDELGDVQIWQVLREINEIRQLDQNPATDWYYNMIVYLANTILNLGIPY